MTSHTYARGGLQPTTAGAVIIAAASLLAAVVVLAGLFYAAGTSTRHKAALAAAGCEPNLSPSGLQCTTVWTLERRYTTITTSAMQQLNTDVAAYNASERRDLAAAEAALRAEVTSANAFTASLARFPFPPAVVPRARALMQAIHDRVKLTLVQARSSSLRQLRSFNARVRVAGAAVRTDMTLLRTALYQRPVASQEP